MQIYRVNFLSSMYFVPHFGHTKVYETSIWTPCFQIMAKTMFSGLKVFFREPNCIFKSYLKVLRIETSTSLDSLKKFEGAPGEFKGALGSLLFDNYNFHGWPMFSVNTFHVVSAARARFTARCIFCEMGGLNFPEFKVDHETLVTIWKVHCILFLQFSEVLLYCHSFFGISRIFPLPG